MAMRVPVRQMSGKVVVLEVMPEMTIREFKQMLKVRQPSEDKFTRSITMVEVVVEGCKLEDEQQTLTAAGISSDSVVHVLFTVNPVVCVSRVESGFHQESLRVVTVPETVTEIASCAFSNCIHLAMVTLPSSLNCIRDQAFHGCSSLSKVNIPDAVAEIGAGAFFGCRSLTTLAIPNSVVLIG